MAEAYEQSTSVDAIHRPTRTRALADLHLDDAAAYALVRGDIYRRFVADDEGDDIDSFGRRGTWIPRGSQLYLDLQDSVFVKVFDPYFCELGEGRFLGEALASGLYDTLCPGLEFVIRDSESIRGYGIRAGVQLSRYEFDRYVGDCLRPVVLAETARTGLYFNDLEFHNVIRHGDTLSFIDLESVLPVDWFGTDLEFARRHLDVVDIGWPVQSKWNSPKWYAEFLNELTEGTASPSDGATP